MKLPIYQIDAFASQPFTGNPAAICPLEQWLPDELMQNIASENNLSETAFFVKNENDFHIRWFTPNKEVDLCGHATLASAYVIFNLLNYQQPEIKFSSRSGILTVSRDGDYLAMDFPTQPPVACEVPHALRQAFKSTPIECLMSEDYIVVFEQENDILKAAPDMQALSQLNLRGVAITAKSDKYDFICRFFAPRFGIDEDPVTGSAFTQLIPYWTNKLGKNTFIAKQVSARGGEVIGEYRGNRVLLKGKAVKYLEGQIEI
ncbi:MAG: PhzF family phenazine biosynthesis protein [Gammaproteobacteria bacterium]|nr:PhzF family phenazine biosynthesis protein [Gammaproteobacteria bacterium]